MTIGINCGHTIGGPGYGAAGIIKESEHTRLVGKYLMDKLKNADIEVTDCTVDKADTQNDYLKQSVEIANAQDLDLFLSIHFNASSSHTGNGVECFTYKCVKHEEAVKICQNIANLGFSNRGVKDGSGLYVVKNTKAKAILVEVCFCDNEADVSTYLTLGEEKIAQAICEAIIPCVKEQGEETSIMGENVAKEEQLNELLMSENPRATGYLHLAKIFLEEGEKEGVRGDGAFCQSLIETGYFKFGGDVQSKQHNYAGLGATGGVPGLYFQDDRIGIRAQIQHLKAYASTDALFLDCADPRYKYVKKGCAATFEQLSGKWAVPGYDVKKYASLKEAREAKDSYGDHIVQLMERVGKTETMPVQPEENFMDETALDGMLYVVQVGAYKNLDNARKLQQRLEQIGVVSVINQYKQEVSQ